jgi:hypothetical protein
MSFAIPFCFGANTFCYTQRINAVFARNKILRSRFEYSPRGVDYNSGSHEVRGSIPLGSTN